MNLYEFIIRLVLIVGGLALIGAGIFVFVYTSDGWAAFVIGLVGSILVGVAADGAGD